MRLAIELSLLTGDMYTSNFSLSNNIALQDDKLLVYVHESYVKLWVEYLIGFVRKWNN